MEILRFDEARSFSSQRKKSSKGMLVVGLVATLFGISSAFASSTISINSDAPIALGQGVTTVTACDTAISVAPRTLMKIVASKPVFYLETITVTNVDTSTVSTTTGLGCAGKYFDLQVFHTDSVTAVTSPYDCTTLKHTSANLVTVTGGASITSSCTGSTVSFLIPASGLSGNPVFSIPFADGPADISYVTLVSRDA
ncbi:hypothetical protein MCEMRE212_01049 [Candidatus Nanopelagicaceae bacterium]